MTATMSDLLMMNQKTIEQQFAACLMVNPVQTIQDCGWLSPDVILDERIKSFWRRSKEQVSPATKYDDAHETITQLSMETGLMFDLIDTIRDLPSSMVPSAYAKEISRRSYIINQTENTQKLISALRLSDDEEARKIIRVMAEIDVAESTYLPTAYDVATEFQEVVNSGQRSIRFGIGSLDNATGGQERKTLTILASRPSVGKTALGWQVAQSAAYSGKTADFFSMEMSSVNLWGRAACPKVGVTWRDVRAGKLNQEQRERLVEESFSLALQFEDRLRIIDTPQTSETIWRTVAEHRPDLVIVDHLRLIRDRNISEVKRLGEISQRLKEMSKSFNCAVLLLAQLNRQSEMRQERRPILADLRDSGEIEENGDLILMLHRDEPQSNVKPEKSITEIWVRKFRDGPRDILIKLLFDPKQEWFEELPR